MERKILGRFSLLLWSERTMLMPDGHACLYCYIYNIYYYGIVPFPRINISSIIIRNKLYYNKILLFFHIIIFYHCINLQLSWSRWLPHVELKTFVSIIIYFLVLIQIAPFFFFNDFNFNLDCYFFSLTFFFASNWWKFSGLEKNWFWLSWFCWFCLF